MIESRIKTLWAAGKPAINGWLSIGNAFTAELVAAQGFDSVTIDLQHGVVDYAGAVGMLQALGGQPATPLVRVPWLDPAAIMKALDAGAFGVICPMINTAEQARALVSYVRYPPHGERSFGPTRAQLSAGPGYGDGADATIVCFAMIETQTGYDNVDAIVATPGLDAVYIGPGDLTLGLTGRTHPVGLDREEPEMLEAIRHILDRAHGAGIRAGIHCGTPAYAAKAIGWGFDFVSIASDARLLSSAAAAMVAETRGLIDGATPADGAKGGRTFSY